MATLLELVEVFCQQLPGAQTLQKQEEIMQTQRNWDQENWEPEDELEGLNEGVLPNNYLAWDRGDE